MSSTALAQKDVNASLASHEPTGKADIKSMEYHRQVLKSKMAEEKYCRIALRFPPIGHADKPGTISKQQQYISPSDNIMSPCSAKLNALRNKHASKYVLNHNSLTHSTSPTFFAKANHLLA